MPCGKLKKTFEPVKEERMAANGEKRTRWHRLLGKLLEEALNPVGVMVYTDFPIMSEPPKSDVLLLRNEKDEWTPEQNARLVDGIRDCRASRSFQFALPGRSLEAPIDP